MPTGKDSQKSSDDVSCREMARFFKGQKEHYTWSDRYVTEVHDSPSKTGRTEREHMVSWFGANPTTGSGAYSRQSSNNSAKVCYNRLQNAASLLWIAEAVGVDGETVGRAFRAAAACDDRRRACRAVREEIPWDVVSLRYLALKPSYVRRVLGAYRDIGGGSPLRQ